MVNQRNKIILPIPLPDNMATGWSCGEVAVVAAFEYFGIKPILNQEYARELTKKIPGYNTWPEQLLRIAANYPKVRATVWRSYARSKSAFDRIQEAYPKVSAETLLAETDVEDLDLAISDCERNRQYQVEPITLNTILSKMKPWAVVIPWVCYDTLYDRVIDKGFNAHYVILTGFDMERECVYLHECGNTKKPPEANKPIQFQHFLDALGPDPNFMVWELR